MSVPYFSVVYHTIMLNFIDKILCQFESCFSRKASFRWFVTIIIGFILRSDKLGVTSVIRLFWFSIVKNDFLIYKEVSLHVLVGDGVKQPKEGRRMPGVKKLFQESENSSKPEYIHGHMFGGLGILTGNPGDWACVPLSIRLHDGLQAAHTWKGASVFLASHVLKMVGDAYCAAQVFGDCLLLLDRYFLTLPLLEALSALNRSGPVRLEIVTKAKKNCIAYEKPVPKKPGRGRPPKKGDAIRLKEWFASHKEQFLETQMELYGKQETIRYYSIDLLWGQKLYQELRFVLVERNGVPSILASTGLELEPLSIIRLYSYRMRIECTFRELNQQIGAFCYHFWSKHMPKLSYYQKAGEPGPLERVKDERSQRLILKAIRATEMHMVQSCIAMGILQGIFVYSVGKLTSDQLRYQRTPSRGRVSEGALMAHLRKYFSCLWKNSRNCI